MISAKWVNDTFVEYLRDSKCERLDSVEYADGTEIITVMDTETKKAGCAIRMPEDEPDIAVGTALAYARLRNKPIPRTEEINVDNMKFGVWYAVELGEDVDGKRKTQTIMKLTSFHGGVGTYYQIYWKEQKCIQNVFPGHSFQIYS